MLEGYDGYVFGGCVVSEGVKLFDGDGEEEKIELLLIQMLLVKFGGDGIVWQVIVVLQLFDGNVDMQVEMDYQDVNGEMLMVLWIVLIFVLGVQLGIKIDGWLMKQDDLCLCFVVFDMSGKLIKGQKIVVVLYSCQVLIVWWWLIGGFYVYDNQMWMMRIVVDCFVMIDV